MKVYLAGPYNAREQLRGYAAELARIGFTVTSSWLTEQHQITAGTQGAATDLNDEQAAGHAATDLADIDRSDLLLLFTAASVGVEGGGGRHVETGYAIANAVPVIVVGWPENIFHRLPLVCTVMPDWREALLELSTRPVKHAFKHRRASDHG